MFDVSVCVHVCTHMSANIYVHVCTGQRKVLDPLDQDLQAVVSWLTWVLGIEHSVKTALWPSFSLY